MAIMASASDMTFMIDHYFDFTLFGQKLSVTSTHISIIIVDIVILAIALYARHIFKHPKDVPGVFQNVIELAVEMLDSMVSENMGKNAPRFRNYIGSIFLFILLSNISGILGLRSPTADYGVTLLLGLVTFAMIHLCGMKKNGLKHFKIFIDPFVFFLPINLVSEIATPLSLSLRLFGNVMSGTVMLGLWYSLMPWFAKLGIPSFLHAYFDLFSGAIQTYVFCMLTMVYVQQKISDE